MTHLQEIEKVLLTDREHTKKNTKIENSNCAIPSSINTFDYSINTFDYSIKKFDYCNTEYYPGEKKKKSEGFHAVLDFDENKIENTEKQRKSWQTRKKKGEFELMCKNNDDDNDQTRCWQERIKRMDESN